MPGWKRSLLFIALAAFVAGVMFAGGYLLVNDLKSHRIAPLNNVASAMPGVSPETVADIVDKAGPAVVKIDTVVVRGGSGLDPFFDDPFFRQFFGRPFGFVQPHEEHGLGSGFIFSPEGYIITNEHVISGAQKIMVTIQGFEKPLAAKVVGADYDLDLAVIKVDAGRPLPTLPMGDSDQTRVGEWVVAIGNPFGLDHTVTVGVISAKGRPVTVENRHYKNLLQTDASINPGNSGGPLLNLKGEVIGINTAVAQAHGIGFAIPANTVKEVLDQLLKGNSRSRPWLGIQMQSVTPEVAAYLGLPSAEGVLVVNVIPGSPADEAGLARGDVILQVDNQKVRNSEDLLSIIQQGKVGQRVNLQVFRGGRVRSIAVTLGEKPPQWR